MRLFFQLTQYLTNKNSNILQLPIQIDNTSSPLKEADEECDKLYALLRETIKSYE